MKSASKLFGTILLAAAIAGCDDMDSDVITVFPVLCIGADSGTTSCDYFPIHRVLFKVLVVQQQVIYWEPGMGKAPGRLNDCVVANRKYWVCSDGQRGEQLTMIDGKLQGTPETLLEFVGEAKTVLAKRGKKAELLYISGLRWWLLELRSGLLKDRAP